MGVIQRLFAKRDKPGIRAEPLAAARTISSTRADWALSTSEAVYAAVTRISNTIAQLPLHLYKGWELQSGNPLERMVAYAPNDMLTAYQFQQAMEVYRNVEGNAYALIVPDASGAPMRLDVLDASMVEPVRDTDTGDLWYQFRLDDGRVASVHSSCMIALHHASGNGQRGIRPIDVLRGTLDYDRQIKQVSIEQLQGVTNGVMLTVPGTGLSEDKRKAVVKQFISAYRESSGHVMVLEGGITASTLAQSPVDAKVLDVERITRNRVATVYSIPPHMLGDYSDTSYSTAEQTMREYIDLTIMPIVVQWEHEYARKLLTWDMIQKGYRFRFDLKALSRADTATMANMHQQAIRGGWMSVNEARADEGLPPVKEGERLLASKDLMPLSEIARGGTLSGGE